jgi:hypothetical protein
MVFGFFAKKGVFFFASFLIASDERSERKA